MHALYDGENGKRNKGSLWLCISLVVLVSFFSSVYPTLHSRCSCLGYFGQGHFCFFFGGGGGSFHLVISVLNLLEGKLYVICWIWVDFFILCMI